MSMKKPLREQGNLQDSLSWLSDRQGLSNAAPSRARIPCSLASRAAGLSFFLDILHAVQTLEVLVLRPECGVVSAGGGKDDAVCQWQFQFVG